MSAEITDPATLAASPVEDASLLTQKYGRGTTNYFSGTPINRLSFLRADSEFLTAAFTSPEAHVVVFQDLSPLVKDDSTLAYVSVSDITPVTGAEPFAIPEDDVIKNYDSSKARSAPQVVFLGIREEPNIEFSYRTFTGRPYFAVDISAQGSYAAAAESLAQSLKDRGLYFLKSRVFHTMNNEDAAIFSQARSIIDWNDRHRFCAACGCASLGVGAGYKRVCPPHDNNGVAPGCAPTARGHCPTRVGISNLCFPRSDPVMIAAVVSADGRRCLLGRQPRFPAHWYSTLSGFLEPGESVEEAVRREVWEESGVRVGRVVLHSTQPWPFPANLMIGALAQALPDGETINLGHDNELEDARWFTMDELRVALASKTLSLGEPNTDENKDTKLLLPPPTAIANRLVAAVVDLFGNTPDAKI